MLGLAFVPIVIGMTSGNFIIQRMFLNNNNPLLLVTTASMVVSAYKHPTYNIVVNWLAKSILAIYLILEWPDIRELFNPFVLSKVIEGWGVLLVPIVALACILIESARRRLTEKPIQWIVDKISNYFLYE